MEVTLGTSLFLFLFFQVSSSALHGQAKDSNYVLKELNKPSAEPTNPTDKEILEEFYRSTAGPAWLQNAGWLSGDPCQSMWYGIRCSQSGDVVEITLSHNQLAGELPSSLGNMKSLQVLRLYDNIISGILPLSLFTMKSLTVLDLDNNQLYGTLPTEISMPALTNLSLSSNQIGGYLPFHWNCPQLHTITLISNSIIGPLPSSMSELSSLKYLDLSGNIITGGFPPELGSLTNLETFFFRQNRGNEAGPSIPEAWRKLESMKNFQADSLTGDLPDIIGSWSNLEVFSISYGQLTGELPTSICNLKSLQILTITSNMISGTIPRCLCDLPATTMTNIDLSTNHLTGEVPDCFGGLHNLTYFDLSNNNFSGNLPSSLGSCSRLTNIQLGANRFKGSIPYTYAKLTKLHTFEVEGNKLNTVDDGLEQFFNYVTYCSLYGNPWTCPLPSYFAGTRCNPECSKCNSISAHTSCKECMSASECGWCTEGPNCLEGTIQGPTYEYKCEPSNWIYGIEAACNEGS